MIKKVILILVMVLLFSGCYDHAVVKFENVDVDVMVANTPEERVKGLTVLNGLSENEGMLFVFEDEEYPSFWMKDMKFSIDMIFISVDGKIVGIEKDVQPCFEECEVYGSYFPAKYVLEVSSGFVEAHKIRFGDNLEIHF